jgi:HlyD family type I secretion membrane fusion protein
MSSLQTRRRDALARLRAPDAAPLDRGGASAPAPTNPWGFVFGGVAVIGLAFGAFGGWAAFAPLDSAVVAPGVLVVESHRRDVQHSEGGIVREILVKEGSTVAAGDVLLLLESTRADATLAIVRAQTDAILARQARLRAEAAEGAAIEFPAALLERQDDPATQDLINGQMNIFMARRASVQGQIGILVQRVAQLERQRDGLRMQGQSRDRQIQLIGEELRGTRELADKGHAPRTRVLALERDVARLEGERGEHLSAVSRVEEAIGETRLQMLQVQRNLYEEITNALQEAQTKLLELQEKMTAARDTVERTALRAPADGVVVGLAVHTIGAVIPPGRTVMQVVPGADRLVIEAQVQILDIGQIAAGQSATVNFSAVHQRNLPTLTGTVATVSADRLTDERTGMPFFKARVTIDEASLAVLSEHRILPGMPADVVIATGERTALRYVADPFLDFARYAMRER